MLSRATAGKKAIHIVLTADTLKHGLFGAKNYAESSLPFIGRF
jgi:hypothetical protein